MSHLPCHLVAAKNGVLLQIAAWAKLVEAASDAVIIASVKAAKVHNHQAACFLLCRSRTGLQVAAAETNCRDRHS